MTRLSLAVVLLLSLSAGGCKKKDLVGVGPYRFGETTLAEAEKAGRCIPVPEEPEIVQCLGMPTSGLGGKDSLFFSKKTGLIAELEVSIQGCDRVAVTENLQAKLGEPVEKQDEGRRVYWQLDRMFVSARLPAEGNECLINFVTNADKERIAALKSGK